MLFETRYVWTVFTSGSPGLTSKLEVLFERSKFACASSATIHEVCKQTLAGEEGGSPGSGEKRLHTTSTWTRRLQERARR